jgi:hypothetical protein
MHRASGERYWARYTIPALRLSTSLVLIHPTVGFYDDPNEALAYYRGRNNTFDELTELIATIKGGGGDLSTLERRVAELRASEAPSA